MSDSSRSADANGVRAGSRLGPYEVLAPIGSGGMGEVFLALDTRLGRHVAVKVLPAELSMDPKRLARLDREARAASALNHPNIVTVYDVGSSGSTSYIAMEFVEGKTLRDLLLSGPLPVRRALAIAAQVADGLAKAHAAGIVHRDLKPENLMISKDGFAKILDFGLARFAPRESGELSRMQTVTKPQTEAGTVLGTVAYMSPEQARGETVDFRSDQFSFGGILYEMVTGMHPFKLGAPAETVSAILRDEPAPLAETAPTSPEALRWIIERCLSKEPEERYGSTRDLARDLRRVGEQLSGPRSSATPVAPKRLSVRLRFAGLTLATAAAVAVAVFFLARARSPSAEMDSLAVLPFVNATPAPDTEYLSDGITDTLIDSLSRLPRTKVISHASVFRYKGKQSDPQQVGRELNVRTVLTGSVLRQGDDLTIGAELVDARDGRHIWGDRYVRKFADVIALQTEIAREISEKLALRLSSQERERLAGHETKDPEAYQLCLQGRYFSNKRTPENIAKAIGFFQKALERDPAYALASANLAESYALLGSYVYGAALPKEVVPKARAAALDALRLDDGLAEARTTLAHIEENYDWNWSAAEKDYRQAIALNPNYATAHHWYSRCLYERRRFDEALLEIDRARRLDPLSLSINVGTGWALYYARRFDEAISACERTLELDPNYGGAYSGIAVAREQKRQFPEAIEAARKAIANSRENPGPRAQLAHALALSGRVQEARAILEDLRTLSTRRYIPAYWFAVIEAGLGEKDLAFQWLEKSFEQRESALTLLNVEPILDGLRPDPRYQDLVRRVGLPR
jgi:eukaryotic-like serine/threonine-protein kinase